MRRMLGAGVTALVLAVAGCDAQRDAGEEGADERPAPSAPASSRTAAPSAPAPPGTTPPSASARPAPSSTLAPAEVLVTATASGGIDGRRETVVVRGDGTYTVATARGKGRHGRMTPAGLAALRAALDAADLAKLPSRPTGPPVPDGITWVIAYDGRTAVTADGSGSRSPLTDVIAALPPMR